MLLYFVPTNTPIKSWLLPAVLTFFMVVLSLFRFVCDVHKIVIHVIHAIYNDSHIQ
jgi:hypothetical protein